MKKPEDIQGHKGLKQDTAPKGIKEPAIKKGGKK